MAFYTSTDLDGKQRGLSVARTILQQLGGNKFVVMTGAKNLVGSENGLSMKIGRNSSKSHYFKVTLTPMDTYTLEFSHVRKAKFTVDQTYEHVYADQLRSIFESHTGMRTSL